MSFIGTGKIKIATYASGATFAARNFIDVGNASDFSFNFSEKFRAMLQCYVVYIHGTMILRRFPAVFLSDVDQ